MPCLQGWDVLTIKVSCALLSAGMGRVNSCWAALQRPSRTRSWWTRPRCARSIWDHFHVCCWWEKRWVCTTYSCMDRTLPFLYRWSAAVDSDATSSRSSGPPPLLKNKYTLPSLPALCRWRTCSGTTGQSCWPRCSCTTSTPRRPCRVSAVMQAGEHCRHATHNLSWLSLASLPVLHARFPKPVCWCKTAGAPCAHMHAGLQQQSLETLGFWIPPPVAVAHHLIRTWAMHEGPWFPEATATASGGVPKL